MRAGLRTGIAVAALAVAGLLSSCGSDSGEMTDPPIDGAEIRVAVMLDGDGTAGVVVQLFQSGGETPQSSATTNANGTAVFDDLLPGSYEVEVAIPSGTKLEEGEARRGVSVAAGESATVTFQLTSPPASGEVEIQLTSDLRFSPSALTVEVGTTVRWVNDVAMFHTITPEGHAEWSEGTVTSAGDTFEHTFNTEGTFPYFCAPHQNDGMTGVITVQ